MLSAFVRDSAVTFNSKKSAPPGIWMQQGGKEIHVTGNIF